MNIAAIIILALHFIGIGLSIALHGSKKKNKHNAYATITSTVILFVLYYFAGIFN